MEHSDIKKLLLENSELIANAFRRPEKKVIEAIQKAEGDKQEMYTQILSYLNIPINIKTIIVLNSILLESGKEKHWLQKLIEIFY